MFLNRQMYLLFDTDLIKHSKTHITNWCYPHKPLTDIFSNYTKLKADFLLRGAGEAFLKYFIRTIKD